MNTNVSMPRKCFGGPCTFTLVLLSFVACAASPLARQRESRDQREGPQIVLLTAPGWVEIDRSFKVAVTAADPRGVAAIELEFNGQLASIAGRGQGLVSGVGTFRARLGGRNELSVVAVRSDGRARSLPSIRHISLGSNDSGPSVAISRAYFDQLSDTGYSARTGALGNPSVGLVPIRVDGRPWWTRWTTAHGPKPFDWQTNCPAIVGAPQGITPFGEVLECWLALHPNVASGIVWEALDPHAGVLDEFNVYEGVVTPQGYADWTDEMKTEFHVAFYFAWEWMHDGLGFFNGEYLPPVPDNLLAPLADHDSTFTVIDHDVAWKLYLGTIAHSLAVEIGGFVPWSISAYSPGDLSVLFNSASMFVPSYGRWYLPDNVTIRSATGYFVDEIIIAPPTMNFEFMVSQDMIRPTQYQTVGQYLDWGRENVIHTGQHTLGNVIISDGRDAISAESYWGYRGLTPASRVIDPPPTIYGEVHASWLFGCPAMSRFTQELLRAVNLPAQTSVANVGQTGHTVPFFWTIGYTMSHGDDMYDARLIKSTPQFPASHLLIPIATFNNWFWGPGLLGPDGSANVGRQLIELGLEFLPDVLVQDYCADKAANLSHANGSVAEFFRSDYYNATYYTPAQLAAKGLWTKLGAKAAAMGLCAP